jgi:hypothetical protein
VPTGPDGCPQLGSAHPPAGRSPECAILAGASVQFHAGANILKYGARWPHEFPHAVAAWPRFWIPLFLSPAFLLIVRRLALGPVAEWVIAVPLIWVCASGAHDILMARKVHRAPAIHHEASKATHTGGGDLTLHAGTADPGTPQYSRATAARVRQ